MLVFCVEFYRYKVQWSTLELILQCLILHILQYKWQCPHPNPSHCEGFCTALQVAYGKARTVIAYKRFCSHPVVELAIAEMACVSRNVRRTLHVPSLLFQILRTVKDFPTFHF